VVTAAGVARTLAATLALSALSGCAEILDIPSTDTLSLAPSGPWRCLSEPADPVVPSVPRARVRFRVCDFISNCTLPVTGLEVRLCDKLDIGCINPRLSGIRDKNGLIELEVPTGPRGFDGYVQVATAVAPCFDTQVFGAAAEGLLCQLAPECDPSQPSAACNVPIYSPAMWFFNPPIVADLEEPISLQLYPTAALPLVLDAAGGDLVPGTGSVFMTVVDCDGQPAPGVTLEIAEYEDVAAPLYFDSGVLSNTASQTDSAGIGGFIRIPPGFVEITGVDSEGVPMAKVGLQASAGFVTLTVLAPSSAP
jgi:hypothetical protein